MKNRPRHSKLKPSGLHPKPKSGTTRVGQLKPRRCRDKAKRETIIFKVPDMPEGSRRDGG